MKNKFLALLGITIWSLCLHAQVDPPTAPLPPAQAPNNMDASKNNKMHDTMKINIGDRQIMIIEKENKNREINVESQPASPPDAPMPPDAIGRKSHKENTNPEAKKKSHKAADMDFFEMDLGVNLLFNNKNDEQRSMDMKIKPFESWSWTFNFLPTKVYLGSRNLMLMTALGWRYSSYEFSNSLNFTPKKTIEYVVDNNVKCSEFDIHQLQIPLMIYLQSKKLNGLGKIGIGFGGYAGLLVHQQHEIKTTNSKKKTETNEDFGFNPYRYGLSTRLDIGPLKLFANYDLSSTWVDTDFKNAEVGVWFDF